jgi:hypothetical protein
MRTYRRIIATFCLAIAPLIAFASAVPAGAAAATPPPPCAGGLAPWYLPDGLIGLYLDPEGIGNDIEVTSTQSCWHVPSNNVQGTITDNSRNCADYYASQVIMFTCNGAQAEQWIAVDYTGGSVIFKNVWAIDVNNPGIWLSAQSLNLNAGVGLNSTVDDLDEWHI